MEEENKRKPPLLGISLGRTNVCVAVWHDGKVKVIPNEKGNRTTPFVAAFDTPQGTLAGEEALFRCEIISMILAKLKKCAEEFLGTKIRDAVIACPDYFYNPNGHTVIENAGSRAGLNVINVIRESWSVGIAYGFYQSKAKNQNILIFNLGGETLEISIFKVLNVNEFDMPKTESDAYLGGKDFDSRLVDFVDEMRAKFDELCSDLFKSTLKYAHKALGQAKMDKNTLITLC